MEAVFLCAQANSYDMCTVYKENNQVELHWQEMLCFQPVNVNTCKIFLVFSIPIYVDMFVLRALSKRRR